MTDLTPPLAASLSAHERKRPATMALLAATADALLSVFDRLRVGPRLSDLEARLAAVEAQGLPRYEGIHESAKAYRQGSLVTRSGSLWLAVEPTDRTPGQGASGWKLIVKAGAA